MTSVCTATTLARIADTPSFTAWKSSTDVILNSISPTTSSGTTPPSLGETTTLTDVADKIFETSICLNEKITELSSTTNKIQKAQEDIIHLTKAIDDAKEHAEISKNRVEYVRNPDQHTSFYESWFPIGRPMYQGSIPIFIGIIVFLGVLPVVILLSYMFNTQRLPGQPPGLFTRIYNAIYNISDIPGLKIANPPSIFTRLYNAIMNTRIPNVIPAPKPRLPF